VYVLAFIADGELVWERIFEGNECPSVGAI